MTSEHDEESSEEAEKPAEDESSEDAPVSKAQAFLRILIVTVVMFGLLEVVARVVLYFRTKSANAAAAADYPPGTYLTDFTARVDYRFINFYTADPVRANNEAYTFDSFGFRLDSRKLAFDAPSSFKKIWVLGGSTVQGLGVLGEESVPAQLNALLERDGSPYRAINMGQAGFTSTQELLLFIETLQAGFKPDLVVSYDGASEVPFASDPVKNGYPGWEKRDAKAALLLDIQGGESAGSLLPLTLLRLTKMDDLMLSLSKPAPDAKYPNDNWDVVARRYLTTLGMIKANADLLKVPSFFFFQPVIAYEDHFKSRAIASDEQRFLSRVSPDEWKRVEAVNAPALEALRERIGSFADIHEVFRGHDGEKLYADPRHPNGKGNTLVAARIYDSIKTACK